MLKSLYQNIIFISLASALMLLSGCSRHIYSTYDGAPNLEAWTAKVKGIQPKGKITTIKSPEKKEMFSYKDHIFPDSYKPKWQEQSHSVTQLLTFDEEQDLLAHKLRNPFELPYIKPNNDGPRPNKNRIKQPLENYPLTNLTMVGTIGHKGGIKALISSPDHIVYQVKLGQYMGKHDGKVIGIDPHKIILSELYPNGEGGWIKKQATIVLNK